MVSDDVSQSEIKKSYLAFKKTPLYKVLASQRESAKFQQYRGLIEAGLRSTDSVVRAISTQIVSDGVTWTYLNGLELSLFDEKKPASDEGERQYRAYNLPDIGVEDFNSVFAYTNPV